MWGLALGAMRWMLVKMVGGVGGGMGVGVSACGVCVSGVISMDRGGEYCGVWGSSVCSL